MPTFSELTERFEDRHIGPRSADLAMMLDAIGVGSADELIAQTVPDSILDDRPLTVPEAVGEAEALNELRSIAERNRLLTNLIGLGYYGTALPAVIRRNVLEAPGWYTAYTPYQPEISQGRLEALINFQTMVCDLTGLDIANSSLLDEATAAAEAMALARRTIKGDRHTFFVHADTHPQTLAVLETRAEPVGVRLAIGDESLLDDPAVADDLIGGLLSYPTSTGAVVDWSTTVDRIHDAGGLAIVATDLLACVLLRSPGAIGADIAIGSAQRFGVPIGYGGPHAGFMAVRSTAARSLPGRLVGVSTDSGGRPALRLALQTREQHIRREKATSNICTAQVLLANIAGLYAAWHGPDGLTAIASRVHGLTNEVARRLGAAGRFLRHDTWFDTLAVEGRTTPAPPDGFLAANFDAFAPGFERQLVERLEYSAPWTLADLGRRLRPEGRFAEALDIGCGTGLVARAFQDGVVRWTGVDLAPKMLEIARSSSLYHRLEQSEAAALLTRDPTRYDLAVAADLLIYLGEIGPLFSAVASRLEAGGLFLFSTERCRPEEGPCRLRPTGRYAQSDAHIEELAGAAGLTVVAREATVLRKQHGAAVDGSLFAVSASGNGDLAQSPPSQ